MTWKEYVSDHLTSLLLHLTGMAFLSVFLLATGTSQGVLIIILLVWLLGLAVANTAAFLKLRAHFQELESILNDLDQKYLFAECIPKPAGTYERHLFHLLRRSGRAMVGAVSQAQASQRDYREYVENWVHEVKAPITAAKLICHNAETDFRRKLLPELCQIENHVERALFYARAENPDRDFIIRKTSLAPIAAQALEQHRALLMQSGVCVETENLDRDVYTDEKWAVFLLGQLLQNTVRYRRDDPVIKISSRLLGHQVQLTFSDNGMGIPAHELPRIFDRGFTGSNGRLRGGATGMGLYLFSKLASFLQIQISAHSSQGRGTSFVLTFPSQENLSKL